MQCVWGVWLQNKFHRVCVFAYFPGWYGGWFVCSVRGGRLFDTYIFIHSHLSDGRRNEKPHRWYLPLRMADQTNECHRCSAFAFVYSYAVSIIVCVWGIHAIDGQKDDILDMQTVWNDKFAAVWLYLACFSVWYCAAEWLWLTYRWYYILLYWCRLLSSSRSSTFGFDSHKHQYQIYCSCACGCVFHATSSHHPHKSNIIIIIIPDMLYSTKHTRAENVHTHRAKWRTFPVPYPPK